MQQDTSSGHQLTSASATSPAPEEQRECRACRETKPLEEFYKHQSGRLWKCKECKRKMHRDWYLANNGKDRVFDKSLRRLYGITLEQYNAKKAEQDDRCGLCGEVPGADRRMHVDHDHTTGRVRDLLCHHCNVLLGNARDSAERLRQAVAYLERHGSC